MSKAKIAFDQAILDSEELLSHFDAQPKPPPDSAEVLKRAALVMALTAWETFVEDLVREEVAARLRVVQGSYVGDFVRRRLDEELKRFHNPSAEKTRRLFNDFLDLDVTESWNWQHFDPPKARKTLDELIAKRGDAVHRSRKSVAGQPPTAHLIRREELDKAIRFIRALVEATDKALETD